MLAHKRVTQNRFLPHRRPSARDKRPSSLPGLHARGSITRRSSSSLQTLDFSPHCPSYRTTYRTSPRRHKKRDNICIIPCLSGCIGHLTLHQRQSPSLMFLPFFETVAKISLSRQQKEHVPTSEPTNKASVSLAWRAALIKTVKLSFSKLYNE